MTPPPSSQNEMQMLNTPYQSDKAKSFALVDENLARLSIF